MRKLSIIQFDKITSMPYYFPRLNVLAKTIFSRPSQIRLHNAVVFFSFKISRRPIQSNTACF